MKPFAFLFCAAALSALPTEARMWTNTAGETFEAEAVWVNDDQEVKLCMADGTILIVPFSTFPPETEEHLEDLLFRKIHGDPHPVPWKTMNELFGLNIWKDVYLWDDLTGPAGERMLLKKESETDFMENHRAYPLGQEKVLSEPVYTTVLYGGEKYAESLCFVFLNQGDIPLPDEMSDAFIEQMAEDIEASGMRVHDAVASVLGKPKRDTIGKHSMREKVWRWDWNHQAILLSMQEGKYAMLRIVPSALADRSGKVEKIKSNDLRERMTSCVERRGNGDVAVQNIPMIDQGPKGYCSPATWERYLRYLGIPADMYQLANVGNTEIGGGTYSSEMIDATDDLLSFNGRNLEEVDDPLSIETVAEYIDQGMPIMWSFGSSMSFQKAVNRNTARRIGKEIEEEEEDPGAYNTGYSGHICLITGYNAETGEIAISDSWGPAFSERWFPVRLLREMDMPRSFMYVIKR
jgi:hypothetical protein